MCFSAALVAMLAGGHSQAETFEAAWRGRVARPPSDGIASTYLDRRDARGQRMDPKAISCAHRSEPFGQILIVTNTANGRRIECPVYDRGPFLKGRVLDLSPAANRALGCDGLCHVRVSRKGYE